MVPQNKPHTVSFIEWLVSYTVIPFDKTHLCKLSEKSTSPLSDKVCDESYKVKFILLNWILWTCSWSLQYNVKVLESWDQKDSIRWLNADFPNWWLRPPARPSLPSSLSIICILDRSVFSVPQSERTTAGQPICKKIVNLDRHHSVITSVKENAVEKQVSNM